MPIYVKSGLVTLSSFGVSCPTEAHNASLGIDASTSCLLYTAGSATGTTQSFTYAGVDDNDAAPSGESAFNIAIGPTFSNDANFNKKNDLVRGSVIDNDVLYRSRKSCNTTEGDRCLASYDGKGNRTTYCNSTITCLVELAFDDKYFKDSGDALESSATEFALTVTANTDEGGSSDSSRVRRAMSP